MIHQSCCQYINNKWNSYDNATRKELKATWVTALVLAILVTAICLTLHFTIGHYPVMQWTLNDLIVRIIVPISALMVISFLGTSCCISAKGSYNPATVDDEINDWTEGLRAPLNAPGHNVN